MGMISSHSPSPSSSSYESQSAIPAPAPRWTTFVPNEEEESSSSSSSSSSEGGTNKTSPTSNNFSGSESSGSTSGSGSFTTFPAGSESASSSLESSKSSHSSYDPNAQHLIEFSIDLSVLYKALMTPRAQYTFLRRLGLSINGIADNMVISGMNAEKAISNDAINVIDSDGMQSESESESESESASESISHSVSVSKTSQSEGIIGRSLDAKEQEEEDKWVRKDAFHGGAFNFSNFDED